MSDEWFSTIKIPMTFEHWQQLPRNPAYKYEYYDREAWFTPRPRYYRALLDLEPLPIEDTIDAQEKVQLRPLCAQDWDCLPEVFAAAFKRVQPYGSLDETLRLQAATRALTQTRTGGDGPLIENACFVASTRQGGYLRGAILITLIPLKELTEWDCGQWTERPPPDAIERHQGRPHLTWIFVGPAGAGHGVGTGLLALAIRELLALGYRELASTFLLGNDSSMLWHWRNGFRLIAYPGSWREMRKRWSSVTQPGKREGL